MKRELYQFEYQPGARFAFSAPEHFQGTTLRRIVDTVTGVLYLQAITDQGISMTPLLEVDGEPLVQDPYLRVQLDALSSTEEISRVLDDVENLTYVYLLEDEEEGIVIWRRDYAALWEFVKSHPGGHFDATLADSNERGVRIYPWDPDTRQGGYLEVEVQDNEGLDDVLALPICAGGKPLGVVCED